MFTGLEAHLIAIAEALVQQVLAHFADELAAKLGLASQAAQAAVPPVAPVIGQ